MKIKKQAMANPADNPADDPMKDYEVKDHLETLIKAHGIMADPEKMKKVHKLAGRHSNAIKSIQDVKERYQEKYGSKPKVGDLARDLDEDGE